MAVYDATGKNEHYLNGRYLIHTTAGKIDFSPDQKRRFMIRLFDFGTSSVNKTFFIETEGVLLVNKAVGTFEIERLGDKKQDYFKQLS